MNFSNKEKSLTLMTKINANFSSFNVSINCFHPYKGNWQEEHPCGFTQTNILYSLLKTSVQVVSFPRMFACMFTLKSIFLPNILTAVQYFSMLLEQLVKQSKENAIIHFIYHQVLYLKNITIGFSPPSERLVSKQTKRS